MRQIIIAALTCIGLTYPAALAAEETAHEYVDVEICLLADTSTSMSTNDFLLQRQGHADGLKSEAVLDRIAMGNHRSIAVTYVEWAAAYEQVQNVKWTKIHNRESATDFGDKILSAPKPSWITGTTAIGAAIDLCLTLFKASEFVGTKQIIDIVGNGTDNDASKVLTAARDLASKFGVIINGLAILTDGKPSEHTHPPNGLKTYFETEVIIGNNAFAMEASGYKEFGYAFEIKLEAEIALAQPRIQIAHFGSSQSNRLLTN